MYLIQIGKLLRTYLVVNVLLAGTEKQKFIFAVVCNFRV